MPSLPQLTISRLIAQAPRNSEEVAAVANNVHSLAPEPEDAPSLRKGTMGHLLRAELPDLERRARAAGARGDTDTTNQLLSQITGLLDSNRSALESAAGYSGANAHQQALSAAAQRYISGEFMQGEEGSESLYELSDRDSPRARNYRFMRMRQGGNLGEVAYIEESADPFAVSKLAEIGYGENAPVSEALGMPEDERRRALHDITDALSRAKQFGGDAEAYYNFSKWNLGSFSGVDYRGSDMDNEMMFAAESLVGGALTNSNLSSAQTSLERFANRFFKGTVAHVTPGGSQGSGALSRGGDVSIFSRSAEDKQLFLYALHAARTLASEWAAGNQMSPQDAQGIMEYLMTEDFRTKLQTLDAVNAFSAATPQEKSRKILEYARSVFHDIAPDVAPNFVEYDTVYCTEKALDRAKQFFNTEEASAYAGGGQPDDLNEVDSEAEALLLAPYAALSSAIQSYLPAYMRKEGVTGDHRQALLGMLQDKDSRKHLVERVHSELSLDKAAVEELIDEASNQLAAGGTGKLDYDSALRNIYDKNLTSPEALQDASNGYAGVKERWGSRHSLPEEDWKALYTEVFKNNTIGVDPSEIALVDLDTGEASPGSFIDHSYQMDLNSQRLRAMFGATDKEVLAMTSSLASLYEQKLRDANLAEAQKLQENKGQGDTQQDGDQDPFAEGDAASEQSAPVDPTVTMLSALDSALSDSRVTLQYVGSDKPLSISALLTEMSNSGDASAAEDIDAVKAYVMAGDTQSAAKHLKALVDRHARWSAAVSDNPAARDYNLKAFKGGVTTDLSIILHRYGNISEQDRHNLIEKAKDGLAKVLTADGGRGPRGDFSTVGDGLYGPGQGIQSLIDQLALVDIEAATSLHRDLMKVIGMPEEQQKLLNRRLTLASVIPALGQKLSRLVASHNDDWLADSHYMTGRPEAIMAPTLGGGAIVSSLRPSMGRKGSNLLGTMIGGGLTMLGATLDYSNLSPSRDIRQPVKFSDLPEDHYIKRAFAGTDMANLPIMIEKDLALEDSSSFSKKFGRALVYGGEAFSATYAVTPGDFKTAGLASLVTSFLAGTSQLIYDVVTSPTEEHRKADLARTIIDTTYELTRQLPEEDAAYAYRVIDQTVSRVNGLGKRPDMGELTKVWFGALKHITGYLQRISDSSADQTTPGQAIQSAFGGSAGTRNARLEESDHTSRERLITATMSGGARALRAYGQRRRLNGGAKRVQRAKAEARERFLPKTTSAKDPAYISRVDSEADTLILRAANQDPHGRTPSNAQIRDLYRAAIYNVDLRQKQEQRATSLAEINQKQEAIARREQENIALRERLARERVELERAYREQEKEIASQRSFANAVGVKAGVTEDGAYDPAAAVQGRQSALEQLAPSNK